MRTTWAGWVPLGLAMNAAALLLGAVAGGQPAADRAFLGAEGVAVLLAAWALRDWRGVASEGLAAVALVVYAVLELAHLAVSVAAGMAGAALTFFVVYVAGAATAAVGAVWWQRTLAESAMAVQVIRVGCLLVAVSYLGYLTLGRASVTMVVLSCLGASGMALVAWAFVPVATVAPREPAPVGHSS